MIVIKEALKHVGMKLSGTSIAVQGFGNVGSIAAELLAKEGGKIRGISDRTGAYWNKGGIDIEAALKLRPDDGNALVERGLLRRHEWFHEAAAAKSSPRVPSAFSFGDTCIDFEQLEVRVGEKRMPLTLMEASLLRYFVQHQGMPVPRKEILEKVWGVHEDTDTRAIDNFIVRLRRYVEDDPAKPRHLVTVRGIGYRFVATPEL